MASAPTGATALDTAKVLGRRTLRFADSRELFADVDRLAAADRAGTLRRLGNWTLGQALGHLAWWVDAPFDGYPPDLNPPWFVRLILRRMKAKILVKMPAGARIPKIAEGTKGVDVLGTDEGLARLRRAWARLDAAPPPRPNLIFGPMTHDEWKRLNLAHAELHLSFMDPGR